MKKLLITSLAFNILIVAFIAGKRIYWAYGPPSKLLINSVYIDGRKSVIDQFEIDSNDIVFVGNSLTEGFPLHEYFPNRRIRNRGIGSSFTFHILERVEKVAEGRPRKIFIEIGINDIVNKYNQDSAFNNYRMMVDKIRTISPATEIYIQSLLPVSYNYKTFNDSILNFNRRLESEFSNQNNIEYININPKFLKNNLLDDSYTYDGLHLNGKGYEVWAKAIKKYVI